MLNKPWFASDEFTRAGDYRPTLLAGGHLLVLTLLILPVTLVVLAKIPRPYLPQYARAGSFLRFALPCFLANVPQLLNVRLVQMVMAAAFPAKLLGLYVVALAWGGIVNPILQALGVVLFPRVASRRTKAEQSATFLQGIRIGTTVAILTIIVVTIPTPIILPWLFGRDFAQAIPAALALVSATAISGLNVIFEEGLRGLGELRGILWAEFTGLAVMAVALLFLLNALGVLGAAIATLIGVIATTVVLARWSKKHSTDLTGGLFVLTPDDVKIITQNFKRFARTLRLAIIKSKSE